jgi:membrane protein implicated in regulation of membrane protease activity
MNYRNTQTPEGKMMLVAACGFFFAAIISIIIRELTGMSQTYFWVLFAILFVIGAVIGNTVRKKVQKT